MGKIKVNGKWVVGKHEATKWLGDDASLGNVSFDATQLITATTGQFTKMTTTLGHQSKAVAVTATSTFRDGYGVIPDGTTHATVTSAGAAYYVQLPTPTIGNVVQISEDGTTGFNLITHNPASSSINSFSSSAVAATAWNTINGYYGALTASIAGATTYTECVAVANNERPTVDGNWVCNKLIADGTEAVVVAGPNP